jgi:hypothetical protein
MLRIVRTRTLVTMRTAFADADQRAEEAESVARAADRAATGRQHLAELADARAATAQAQAAAAVAERDELQRSIIRRLTQIRHEALHPDRGEEVRGALALRIVRDWIDGARAETDPEISGQLRILDALLSPAAGSGVEPAQPRADAQ